MQVQMELFGGGGGVVMGVKAKIRELTILNNIFSGCESKEGVAFYLNVCFTVEQSEIQIYHENKSYMYSSTASH